MAKNHDAGQETALKPIDGAKLAPPRSGGALVARARLQAQMLEARRRRCLVLQGPAGCGKTTTIATWRQALLPLGFDVAWLTLTADDNDLARLLDYLRASLAQVNPAIGAEAALFEGRGLDGEAVERTVITLVRGIAAHARELVLVLDDLHCLTDPAIHQALQWLIDYAPANLHLALASRSAVPFSLARLRGQDQVLELDLRDLRFSAEETEHFLHKQLGEVGRKDAQRIHALTDGWVAGLQLLCASQKKQRQGAPLLQPRMRDGSAFAEFFQTEVLAQLSPTDLELLLDMAVCHRFCAAMCAALTGRPQAQAEASALLARLEQDNLFLVPLDSADQQRWYRLHPLLRETLLARFGLRSAEDQRAVHRRAWEWFRDAGEVDEAVRHAVHGGAAEAAAELVEEHAERLYARGDLRLLVELMRQLPAEQIAQRIRLRTWLARIQLYARDFDGCAALLDQIAPDMAPDDHDTAFRIAMLRATLAVQRDDTDGAMAVLPQLLQPPASIDNVLLGGSYNILSWLYMHRGEYELARRIQLDRPPLLVDGAPLLGSPGGSLHGRCLIGLSLVLEGQVAQAERVYREVLHEARRYGKAAAEAAHLAAALLGEVLYETNELAAVVELLDDWVDTLERISMPDSVLRVLEVLAKSRWIEGNHQEAFAHMERLEDYATRLGLDRLQAYSLMYRIYWHLRLGEFSAAGDKLARLDAIDARHPHAQDSALKEIRILTENAHVRWDIAHGHLDQTAQRITALSALCAGIGRQMPVARLSMLAAVIDEQRGHGAQARRHMLAALRLGHRLGLVRAMLDAHPTVLDLIRKLTRDAPLDPLLAFYVERLEEAQRQATPAAPAPVQARRAAPSAQLLSERELEVVRLLAQALPNKKIARALGLSPETVKWHLSHIYSKLGVNSRDEAVARVRDLEAGAAG
jgi:LuxR family maltose regulon positive regulatory protein